MKAPYLRPYEDARQRRIRGVRALLWQDLRDQEIRFDAIVRSCPLAGRHVLDVGCGRAELLGYLREHGLCPSRYTGLEAQPWLVRAARSKCYPSGEIVTADFVREPEAMLVSADVIVFSGSLNFLPSRAFYRSLENAWAATRSTLVFNFLTSSELTGAPGLLWHRPATVLAFARRLSRSVRWDDSYESGDATVVMRRTPARRSEVPAGIISQGGLDVGRKGHWLSPTGRRSGPTG